MFLNKFLSYSNALISLIRKTGYHYMIQKDPNILIRDLRHSGIEIDNDVIIPCPDTIHIDLTRPSLVTIHGGTRLNKNFSILTHDYTTYVFLKHYGEYIPSSGRVSIGHNVYFGRNVTCLKGADIGDNCIIGYGSVVMGKIPSNTVAAGCPAKVISTLDEYFLKRKNRCENEAFEYARSIQKRYGRRPIPADFWEEFPLFVSGDEVTKYPEIPIEQQMNGAFEHYVKTHKAKYSSFDDFLKAAGIK